MPFSRVTVTLPEEILTEMDRAAPNRSRFVLEAVTRELARRRRAALRASLSAPHPESLQVAEAQAKGGVSSLDCCLTTAP
jgi:hypothetical protein